MKCHFLQREVSFLGHRVGGKGISTMEEKVWAVTDWPLQHGCPPVSTATERSGAMSGNSLQPSAFSGEGVGGVLSQVGPDGESVGLLQSGV